MNFDTMAIHAGQQPDPTTGAVTMPVYLTSTYARESLDKHKGYEYARTQNPTREALEKNVAILERGHGACAFASGMAAIHAVVTAFLKSGDHVLVSDNTYGGTYRLFEKVLAKFGLVFDYVDMASLEQIKNGICSNTRMIFLETLTNPLMRICDIKEIANIAHNNRIKVAVDNTFLSPYLLQPIELGADITLHSLTKYLNGHSDSIGGIAVATTFEDLEKLAFIQNSAGAILSPFDAWLTLRGIKTLPVRMRQHDSNGRAIAEYLYKHPKVKMVYYPGLPSHPQYDLACRQMKGFGGMIAFDVGSYENARVVLEGVDIFALAESLGGVESLICHPVSMTHASIPIDKRNKLGITDGLIRISAGIEDIQDLITDLDKALAKL